MSYHADMRRRAAQQASYGNYWAGKCVGLLDDAADEIVRLRAAITEALDLCSDIRCDEHDEEPCPWCLTEILTNALEGATDDR